MQQLTRLPLASFRVLLLVGLPLAGGLGWAQVQPAAPPPLPPIPSAQPGASSPPPTVATPLRPEPERMTAAPPARRFEQSLDELVRQGVISPNESRLMRGGPNALPLDTGRVQQACVNGAISAQECRTGVSMRWTRRSLEDVGEAGTGTSPTPTPAPGRLAADGTPLPPITVPVAALLAGSGGTSFNLADVLRVTPRPAPILGNGDRRLLLPILGAAQSTSGYGWRLHPLLGIWRMHAGEDLAAPEGTPVVAALSGRVLSSGLAGGYGLAVEIEHQRPLRRTLYGHLSELYVQQGDWVRQGEVVGRVGSTGLSTGPHLHFELRQPGDGGWVAVDPGELDPTRPSAGDPIAVLIAQLLVALQRQQG